MLHAMDQLLLIDKPAGWTSHDVVAKLRGILHTRRIGHAGTLDPFATGLLIVGVGKATKELTALVGTDKTYEATAKLGWTSTTFDPEGELTHTENAKRPTIDDIAEAFKKFTGSYEQKAPLFSAKKIGGKKLYDLARAGTATEDMRPTKRITIHSIQLVDYEWPFLKFQVSCSSGTYIRSLADDIGRELGCGAYLEQLRRTRVGDFKIEDATTVEALASK